MSQYPWTSAEVVPPITGEDEEATTGDKEEDPLPKETYLPQDMGAPPHASTVARKDNMCATVLKRSSYPTMNENRPTL